MNTAAILSLIGDLYGQVAQLTQENAQLKRDLAMAKEQVKGTDDE